jgi:hypothetical protein
MNQIQYFDRTGLIDWLSQTLHKYIELKKQLVSPEKVFQCRQEITKLTNEINRIREGQ